jgi:hypothetical protein
VLEVQEVIWDKSRTETAKDYTFFCGNENADHYLGTGILAHKFIISAVQRVETLCDRMSYITQRHRCCDTIVLYVHASAENKCYDTKRNFMNNCSVHSINSLSTTRKFC